MAEKILITGASGLLGTRLTELLLQQGCEVVHLGRGQQTGEAVQRYSWNVSKGRMDAEALRGVTAIIHLAGASVAAKRWSISRKKELIDSRVRSTDMLFQQLQSQRHAVRTFISASAIGYYGVGDDQKVFKEEDAPGNDFLATLVSDWEAAVDRIASLKIRVVKLRIGIVLDEKGGALHSMMKPILMGVGSALGTGKQYISWVHLDDVCEAFVKAMEDDRLHGVYNVAGTQPVTNLEMVEAIARALKRRLWAPRVPSIVLKLILGEMAIIVLEGSKVSSDKIEATGFQFRYRDLDAALRNLIK